MTRPLIRLLFLEDDDGLRRATARVLSRAPFHVEGAASVAEADALLERRHDWCGVIADYHLPDGDGLSLVLRARSRFPGLPVAIVTGDGDPAVTNCAMAAGVDFLLRKPFDVSHVDPYLKKARAFEGSPNGPRVTVLAKRIRAPRREVEVMRGLAARLPLPRIAAELGIKPSTARTLRDRIFDRAGVSTLPEFFALLEGEDRCP